MKRYLPNIMAVIEGQGMTPQIGLLLREWRTAGGFTLGKLAQKAGVNTSALSRWESGGRQPRVPELEATLDALSASPAQRALAFSAINAPRSLRRLRQTPDIPGLGAPPALGDLLRAMRQRKALMQEEVAARLGVRQGTVARWERGERTPSTEQIQALCYILNAREEELVALTRGRFSEMSPEGADASDSGKEERLVEHLNELLNPTLVNEDAKGLTDLVFLTIERKAWLLATQRESARPLFARVLTYHAEALRNAERWADVGPLANRALFLISHRADAGEFVLRAGIMSAAALAFAGNRPAPHQGLHALQRWLALSTHPVYTAWMQSDMAKYAALMGQTTVSLTLAEQARQTAQTTDAPLEIYLRRMDYARLLLAAGQSDAALRELPAPFLASDAQYAQDLLIHAEAHLLSGNLREAQDWLQRSVTRIQTYHLDSLQAKAEALAERM